MLPPHAPPSFSDRSTLWNSVEQTEKSNNSQLAREIELALPVELSREEQTRLVREYCSSQFVSKGMFRKVEIELALQQEVQRLSPKEKEWLLCFLKMNYKEIQKHFGCGHTNVYEKRKKLAETMKALKE